MQVNWHKSAVLAACSLHVDVEMLKLLVEHGKTSKGQRVGDLSPIEQVCAAQLYMQALKHVSTCMHLHKCNLPAEYLHI